MEGYATVPDPAASLVHGLALTDEPGLGALTLPGWFREVTQRHGPREAIAQPRPGRTVERWSYADMWNRAMQVARSLVASGIGKGERIGILMTNRAEFISTFFGTALAGGIAVPLSTFSTRPELDFLLRTSSVSMLLLEPDVLRKDFQAILLDLAPEIGLAAPGKVASSTYPFLQHVVVLDRDHGTGAFEAWDEFLARGTGVMDRQVEERAATVAPADPAAILFSSGSTGKPKGIINAHRGIAIQLWRWKRIWGFQNPGERCWCANGFYWSAPIIMALGGTFSSGGTLVLQATFQPEETLALFEAERVTSPLGWPHQWAQLAAARNWLNVDLSAMKFVDQNNPIAHHPTVKADWQEPTRIYGNTETFTLSTGYCSGTPEEILEGAHGFPLPGMTIKVVDPLTGAILPTGERGELAIKGATLMLGYVGVPLDETLDDEGFFCTGDAGYVDAEGRVYWEGRLNDIIKTGGANVSPLEIDAQLLQCPGVKRAMTVGVPDELLGEMVVSCVVRRDDAGLDEASIRDFLKAQLASYKVPRRVLFLEESQINQTGSAKIKAADLRSLAVRMMEAKDTAGEAGA